MDTGRAIEIVQALADGFDPFTGEQFPFSSPRVCDLRACE